jgi:hypothetical protein
MAVGSEKGTTHTDVLAVDQLFVAGSITGSVINAGTESITQVVETNISAAGTITGSVGNITTAAIPTLNSAGTITGSELLATNAGIKGTLTGSVGNITTINCKGTQTGSVANITTVTFTDANVAGTLTGSVGNITTINAKGTTTGSFFKGTVDGAYVASTIPASGLKKFSVVGTSTGATAGTYAHGLAATPAFVSLVPRSQFIVGTDARMPFLNAAADGTNIYVQAGTTGTIDIYALA